MIKKKKKKKKLKVMYGFRVFNVDWIISHIILFVRFFKIEFWKSLNHIVKEGVFLLFIIHALYCPFISLNSLMMMMVFGVVLEEQSVETTDFVLLLD